MVSISSYISGGNTMGPSWKTMVVANKGEALLLTDSDK